jgi:hypothetical protein
MAMKRRKAGGIEDGRTFLPDIIERSKRAHPMFHTQALYRG